MNNNFIKKLKILCTLEDTSPKRPFLGEHGLSFWIEADEKKILFDTGFSGEALKHNLTYLNLDLKNLDAFVLSHPHDDHSGGLHKITTDIKGIPTFCIRDAFDEYVPKGNLIYKTLTNINYVTENREIFPGTWVIKERGSVNSPKSTKEINLVIKIKNKGLVIIVGCAHHGMLNIINDAKSVYPNEPIYAIIGGFHLKDSGKKELTDVLKLFKDNNVSILAPNHCTGFNALKVMTEELPDAMRLTSYTDCGTFHTGMAIDL